MWCGVCGVGCGVWGVWCGIIYILVFIEKHVLKSQDDTGCTMCFVFLSPTNPPKSPTKTNARATKPTAGKTPTNQPIQPSQCGVVWCGVVWCGVVWCGVVWCVGGKTIPNSRVCGQFCKARQRWVVGQEIESLWPTPKELGCTLLTSCPPGF